MQFTNPHQKPVAIVPDFASIHPELIQHSQWVLWRYEWRWKDTAAQDKGGSWSKTPFQANRQLASSTNPATWADFDAARKAYLSADRWFDGVGFVVTPETGLVGIDLDEMVDANGLSPKAKQIINACDGYVETSPSGTGIRIFVKGQLEKAIKADNTEIYNSGRYLTITGSVIESPDVIPDRTNEVAGLVAELEAARESKKKIKQSKKPPSAPVQNNFDTQALLSKAFNAANGAEIQALFGGNTSAYSDDRSAADLALCTKLAFWSGNDEAKLDEMFRQSALYRDKWNERHSSDGSTYGEMTLRKAISGCGDFYGSVNWNAQVKEISESAEVSDDDSEELPDSYTDDGFLNRFCQRYQNNFVFVMEWGQWLAWNGQKWDVTNGEALLWQHLKAVAIEFEAIESALTQDATEFRNCKKFFAKYLNTNGLKSVTELAKRDMRFRKSSSDFDNHIWLLNCKNGTLDLRTKTLLPFQRDHFFTQQIEVNYNPSAESPEWDKFLAKIIKDADVRLYLHRAVGYSLTGSTSEQCLFICYGGGSNGKSTFVEALEHILGAYHIKAAMRTFTHRESESTSDLARMRSARFVTVSENDENGRLSEGLVKTATGDNAITARFLYQNEFTYTPAFKVWMCVNHRPNIRGTDDGIWRRLKLVPFEVKIDDKEKDKMLGTKLRAESEGILAWAVRGCLDWQVNQLGSPKPISEATEKYRDEMNVIGQWLEESCLQDGTYETSAGELYENYSRWSKNRNEFVMTQTAFGRKLGDLGFGSYRETIAPKRMIRIGLKLA